MAEINPYRQDLDKVVQQLNVPQEGNILITGATGLIGSCLVDLLMRHSYVQSNALPTIGNNPVSILSDTTSVSLWNALRISTTLSMPPAMQVPISSKNRL